MCVAGSTSARLMHVSFLLPNHIIRKEFEQFHAEIMHGDPNVAFVSEVNSQTKVSTSLSLACLQRFCFVSP